MMTDRRMFSYFQGCHYEKQLGTKSPWRQLVRSSLSMCLPNYKLRTIRYLVSTSALAIVRTVSRLSGPAVSRLAFTLVPSQRGNWLASVFRIRDIFARIQIRIRILVSVLLTFRMQKNYFFHIFNVLINGI